MNAPAQTERPHLRVVPAADDGHLEVSTRVVRRFLGMADDEPTELSIFTWGKPGVAMATDAEHHVRLLRESERLDGYAGAYQLVNSIEPAILARYEPNRIHRRAHNGRASDNDIRGRRAIYVDVDAIRPKGISSTDEQLRAAYDVSHALESWLADAFGTDRAIGHGCSGNGYFTLIALEPCPITKEDSARIQKFLALLQKKFGTPVVKIDGSVFNPARLMPAAGSWKRKGVDTPERPHRRTSFSCRGTVERLPLEAVC